MKWIVPVVLLACACGETPEDGSDAFRGCAENADCDDGRFCNGAERCDPTSDEATALGCVEGTPPCLMGMCDEDDDVCPMGCATPDADGDGADAIACGGDDCDDEDPGRFPGNPEVCDAAGVDEDCDGSTFGTTDEDGDGFIDATCCNGASCGDDCDDGEPSAHPGEAESCDTVDNDCDGAVDEGTGSRCWPDADNDGFAPGGSSPMNVCGDCGTNLTGVEPSGTATTDCDDTHALSYPGAREVCDGRDNDCSSGGGAAPEEDADGDGFAALDAPCEEVFDGFPKTDCYDANANVFPGQIRFFEEPRCPPEERCGCIFGDTQAFGCNGSFGFCECRDSWDYNCDGRLLQEREGHGCGFACGGTGPCRASDTPGMLLIEEGSSPRCGEPVQRFDSCGMCDTGCGPQSPYPGRLGCI